MSTDFFAIEITDETIFLQRSQASSNHFPRNYRIFMSVLIGFGVLFFLSIAYFPVSSQLKEEESISAVYILGVVICFGPYVFGGIGYIGLQLYRLRYPPLRDSWIQMEISQDGVFLSNEKKHHIRKFHRNTLSYFELEDFQGTDGRRYLGLRFGYRYWFLTNLNSVIFSGNRKEIQSHKNAIENALKKWFPPEEIHNELTFWNTLGDCGKMCVMPGLVLLITLTGLFLMFL